MRFCAIALYAILLSACTSSELETVKVPEREAPDPTVCLGGRPSLAAIVADIRTRRADATVERANPALAAKLTEVYNALPPPSNFEPDQVVIVGVPGLPAVMVVLVDVTGCAMGRTLMPIDRLVVLRSRTQASTI